MGTPPALFISAQFIWFVPVKRLLAARRAGSMPWPHLWVFRSLPGPQLAKGPRESASNHRGGRGPNLQF